MSMPHFTVAGRNVADVAPFTAHCTFVIHGEDQQGEAVGQFGHVRTGSDLPLKRNCATDSRGGKGVDPFRRPTPAACSKA